jgi:5'-nucleotidase (lipoprotein e(P4) family)
MNMKKRHAISSLWVLTLGLFAMPGVWAQSVGQSQSDFQLPAVTFVDLKASLPQASAVVVAPAQQPSLVDQWKNSVEYAVLLKQNGWKGWSYTSTGKHPAIEWVESFDKLSSEYREQCEKSYSLGWAAVEAAAKSQTGNLAVVLDLDETVLLNLKFQQEKADTPFDPNTWDAWVQRKEAKAVPGAKEFLDKVRGLGPHVHLVYVSDRKSALDAFTIDNMRSLGMFQNGDLMLSKKDKTDNKEVRHLCITTGKNGTDDRCKAYEPMTIIAKFGDSLRDHFEVYGQAAADQTINDSKWGTEDFVLPNPMYGQWARDYK